MRWLSRLPWLRGPCLPWLRGWLRGPCLRGWLRGRLRSRQLLRILGILSRVLSPTYIERLDEMLANPGA